MLQDKLYVYCCPFFHSLSVFTLEETIYPKFLAKLVPKNAKRPPLGDQRLSKTSPLKLLILKKPSYPYPIGYRRHEIIRVWDGLG